MPFFLGILFILIPSLLGGLWLLRKGLGNLIKDIKYNIEQRKQIDGISKNDKETNNFITQNEKLNNLLALVSIFFVVSIISGLIGYLLAKYTSSNIKKFIILGIGLPWGYFGLKLIIEFLETYFRELYRYFEDLYNLLNLITIGIFSIICFVVKIIISAYVGIIALPILIIYFVITLIKISKEK